ncbi:MAG: succinylglutamate desuccinylase [Fuerstiella sp.]|jgi:predicted deacylase|nr:succinylglutamate desuccinylase [Fuerstiella sp.]MCP4510012.1 succinylglutamate desuccinylase [Fuerstiella sp.]MDG2130526.1 succinylglutamate desuccinylase/aspartoacylase family protein [Fuerstiella sp.]
MAVELRQVKFGSGTPDLLITGGVHGDEFEPIQAITRLIDVFGHRSDRLNGRLTLVPCVNEAAFLRGHRCADDGLDLARTCPGNPNGSITKQTAWALSSLIRSADYYIDLHTGGTEFSLYPLAGYVLHADRNILEQQRSMAQAFNLPVIWGTAANLQGRSLSVARDAGVPAIYCEYLGSATCSLDGVDAYVEGCMNVMANLGMIERRVTESKIQHIVEDDRPESGHLQVCNPSPVTGYFEPSVQLGQKIEVGQPLGTVYDLQSGKPHSLSAEHDGIVLMLRTFPRVRRGETVGVVLGCENDTARDAAGE